MSGHVYHKIGELSTRLGFLQFGVADAARLDDAAPSLDSYISKGYNGGMSYMARNQEKRLDPSLLVPNAKSIICFLAPYSPYPPEMANPDGIKVASYAKGKDYHGVIKSKLFEICKMLKEELPEFEGRAFVDTAPVLEKLWAQRAGLGFIGKNTLLINRQHGPRTLIGIIVSNIYIHPTIAEQTEMERDCGSCTKCIEACPTHALIAPYTLDARRCISYHTIETREETTHTPLNRWIFGCDECINACPWSNKGRSDGWDEFDLYTKQIATMGHDQWMEISEEKFNELFKDSPMKRAGLNKLKNNLEQWN